MGSTLDRSGLLAQTCSEIAACSDPAAVLREALTGARKLTDAHYAAIVTLAPGTTQITRFAADGLDAETRAAIGADPRGRGVLRVLIRDSRPLRLDDVESHPESYGFPPGHPVMHTFLGVPLGTGGTATGALYLTDKQGGAHFTSADEVAIVTLAACTTVAIRNADARVLSDRRQAELEHLEVALDSTRDIVREIGSSVGVAQVLDTIAKRGRTLVDARTLLICLKDADALRVVAGAGHPGVALGCELPVAGSTTGRVLTSGEPQRIRHVADAMLIAPGEFGLADAQTALLAPMLYRGHAIGVLAAFNRGAGAEPFSSADEQLLCTFAQAAANAVTIKRGIDQERIRAAIAAADAERTRWARDLHDQTLQGLAALRLALVTGAGHGDAAAKDAVMREAAAQVQVEIAELRRIVSDLRPALLDELGLVSSVGALLDRHDHGHTRIERELHLPEHFDDHLPAELAKTVYRLVQEALTNVIKHAHATVAHCAMAIEGGALTVEIRDNGRGFDPGARMAGFGLAGLRERVGLAGGALSVTSDRNGTAVRAWFPLRRGGRADSGERASPPGLSTAAH